MFRSIVSKAISVTNRSAIALIAPRTIATSSVRAHKVDNRSDDEVDQEIITYLNRKDIDSWQLRKTFQTIHMRDAIPDPNIIDAALRACRHQNDFALAIRFMETVQIKCGPYKDKVWPWLNEQIKPTLTELGIPSLEEIGYDKPELYTQNVMDM